MRGLSRARIVASLALLTLLAVAAIAQAAAGGATTVSVRTSSLGKLLVDGRGHTLYLFGKDTNGKNHCTGTCASFWPPLMTSGKPHAGTGARQAMLGTTKLANGKLQVTYHSHPLYLFKLDTKAGQTQGEGLNKFGALWYAVSPSGTKILQPSTGGGRYP